jgi:hypothetical protein
VECGRFMGLCCEALLCIDGGAARSAPNTTCARQIFLIPGMFGISQRATIERVGETGIPVHCNNNCVQPYFMLLCRCWASYTIGSGKEHELCADSMNYQGALPPPLLSNCPKQNQKLLRSFHKAEESLTRADIREYK